MPTGFCKTMTYTNSSYNGLALRLRKSIEKQQILKSFQMKKKVQVGMESSKSNQTR